MSHTTTCALDPNHTHAEDLVEHADADEHDHAHGLVDRSILRSRAGIRAVSWSLAILTVTALAQAINVKTAAGTQLAWGNIDGTVTVADLNEVQRRLAAEGLGW